MSDDPQEDQVSDEEGTPVEEAVSEEESEDKPLSAENLRAEIDEIGTRAKSAGLKPLRNMVQSYVNQTLDAVDGLLSALEGKGNKRKKGD
jgi:molecular chaperone GrpE (heat shock protein)